MDFAVGKFTITQIRDSVIDYTDPYWHEAAVIVMRKPSEDHLLIYLGPFHWQVSIESNWKLIFVLILKMPPSPYQRLSLF